MTESYSFSLSRRDIKACRDGGYGVLQPGYSLKYIMDSGGNKMALALVDKTTKNNNYVVTVTGILLSDGVTLRTLSMVESNVARVLLSDEITQQTTSIVLNAVVSYTGYLVDLFCWDMTDYIAVDGANLATNPEKHTVGCM